MSLGTWKGQGVLVDFVVLPAHAVAEVPRGVRDGPAAAGLLGVAGQTSAVLVQAAQLRKEQRPLVNGASGGVGYVLTQVLAGLGVHITAICSGKNEDLVRRLGADEYLASTVLDSDDGKQFDAIFDLVGDRQLYTHSPSYLDLGGKYLDIEAGPFGRFKLDNWLPVFLGGTPRAFTPVFSYPSGKSATEAATWVEKGWIKEMVTDSVYSMEEAYEKLATGRATGKIFVNVSLRRPFRINS
ncbi:uncharacterized protein B0I36DRAFT_254090 [Microdochium trichocladiopsis]|uniref:Enoyl reductase (ER) domain-containing protein n=1 Tax=Microdochium trichocladiopsis TaxID=1682393 RepID=A0A9P8XWG8_9PEZI|nr:uncharacterized protein B0I36DRAFT_254090 [Microdochium trichocladiopsis]KAH7016400.1 hypothetical protein B0I36DRAFT_254090 [Microdochium trichocladiopsis]